MGLVYASIALLNGDDLAMVRRGQMDKDEVRHITVRAMVDTGSFHMAINENIQEVLQLPFICKKRQELATGVIVECDYVGPLQVRFGDHFSICNAIVLPDDTEPLLGAIPMEEMNLIVDPQRQELIESSKFPKLVGIRPVRD